MKELKRIEKVFKDLYNGNCWLDETLAGTLEKITAAQAAKKLSPEINSIWELTNHIINWRKVVLKRVKGKVIKSPAHNYYLPVTDVSEKAWQAALSALKDTDKEWRNFLKKSTKEIFKNIYPGTTHSFYDLIQGILQHDAYHLGQIRLLAAHFILTP